MDNPATDVPRDVTAANAELSRIATEAAGCQRCALHANRTKSVPGQGTPAPAILFVGEAPGADEDLQGLAFVGRAGQLLTKMIAAMGFAREEVFIANICKCRPPNNRAPLPEEMDACLPYLRRQIAVLRPAVIVAMGATAVKGLLKTETGITRLRGTWSQFEQIPVMPTFHPAYLLRNPPAKHAAWADLLAVLARLGRKPPEWALKGQQSG
jgi:DNA polymerase